jgi:thioredoxin 2
MSEDTLIITCPQCGQKNRVPRQRLAEGPVCGRCQAALPTGGGRGHPVVVTDETFQQEVLNAREPVLLDCWAPGCPPCQKLAPVLDELAGELAGRVKVAKLNVVENLRTANQFGIRSVPTLLVFQYGQVVDRLVGALPKQAILSRLATVV